MLCGSGCLVTADTPLELEMAADGVHDGIGHERRAGIVEVNEIRAGRRLGPQAVDIECCFHSLSLCAAVRFVREYERPPNNTFMLPLAGEQHGTALLWPYMRTPRREARINKEDLQ